MNKLEGTQFVFDIMVDMGIDELSIEDMELLIASVRRMEKTK